MPWVLPVIAIVAAVGATAATVVGSIKSSEERSKADAARNKAIEEITKQTDAGIAISPDMARDIYLSHLSSQGILTPELEDTVKINYSKVSQIQANPEYKKAQVDALEKMKEQAGGLTAQERADFNTVRQKVSQDTQSKLQSILQNQQARGIAGGGNELAMQLQASQAGANDEQAAGDRIAAEAANKSRAGTQALGAFASGLRNQEFNEENIKASAEDAMNQFNAQNQQQTMSRNVTRKNDAQRMNLAESQRIADANVQMDNADKMRKLAGERQMWQDKQEADRFKYGISKDQTAAMERNAQATANNWANISSGLGQIGSAAGGAYMSGAGGGTSGSSGTQPMVAEQRGGSGYDYNRNNTNAYYASEGGKVPGEPVVDGDHPANDVIDAKLSPGELVIPRTVAEGSDDHIFGFIKGLKAANRKQEEKMACGGEVGMFSGGEVDPFGSFDQQMEKINRDKQREDELIRAKLDAAMSAEGTPDEIEQVANETTYNDGLTVAPMTNTEKQRRNNSENIPMEVSSEQPPQASDMSELIKKYQKIQKPQESKSISQDPVVATAAAQQADELAQMVSGTPSKPSIDTEEGLRDAQQRGNMTRMIGGLGKGFDTLSRGMLGSNQATNDKAYDAISAQGDIPVQQYGEQVAQEKRGREREQNDPNSAYAKSMRATLKAAAGIDVPEGLTPDQMMKMFPVLGKLKIAKEVGSAREELAKKKEVVATKKEEKAERKAAGLDPKQINDGFERMGKDLGGYNASSRNIIGRSANNIRQAKAILALTDQYPDKNNLSKQEVYEVAKSVDTMLSGGVGTVAGTQELIPHTYKGKWNEFMQNIENMPVGADAGKFVERLINTVKKEQAASEKIIKEKDTNHIVPKYEHLQKADPDRFERMIKASEQDYAPAPASSSIKESQAPSAGKIVVKKGYNAQKDQTQLIYSDGSKETVDGKR